MSKVKAIVVQPQRLDLFLHEQWINQLPEMAELSRTQVQKFIKQGAVLAITRDGRRLTPKSSLKLKNGDVVEYRLDSVVGFMTRLFEENDYSGPIKGEVSTRQKLNILYENSDFLIVYKPSGLVVHPGVGNTSGTLANYIRGYLEQKGEFDKAIDRAGIVHRLDKDVKGIMVVAKTLRMQKHLQRQFENHEVEKLYLAQVNVVNPNAEIRRKIEAKQWILADGYIGRDNRDRKKMKYFKNANQNGTLRKSVTFFKAVGTEENGQHLSAIETKFVLVKIITGRKHQIRATLKALGLPVVGDALYGQKSKKAAKSDDETNDIRLASIYLSFTDLNDRRVSFDLLG